MTTLNELIDQYFDVAYQEGVDGRTHDTIDGIAQQIRSRIDELIKNSLTLSDTKTCPDDGTCHHSCSEKCSREDGCVPLSGSSLKDDWTPITNAEFNQLRKENELLKATIAAHAYGDPMLAGFVDMSGRDALGLEGNSEVTTPISMSQDDRYLYPIYLAPQSRNTTLNAAIIACSKLGNAQTINHMADPVMVDINSVIQTINVLKAPEYSLVDDYLNPIDQVATSQNVTVIDEDAVDAFSLAMKQKLKYSREVKGRAGWQDMSVEELSSLLHEHVAKGDPLDVGNLAMMLHQRGLSITTDISFSSANERAVEYFKAATALSEYASYAEIVGGISVNRGQIRKHCDTIIKLKHVLQDDPKSVFHDND